MYTYTYIYIHDVRPDTYDIRMRYIIPYDACATRDTVYMISMTHVEPIIHVILTHANFVVTFLGHMLEHAHTHYL